MDWVKLIFKALPYLLCAAIPSFFLIRNNIRIRKELKDAIDLNKKMVDTEKEKGKVRDEYNEKEGAIVADPAHNGVLPVSPERKHNHSFRDPCGKDGPCYSGD